ncbi:SAM-dependent methyltransferase [Kitasatospora kazusensis]
MTGDTTRSDIEPTVEVNLDVHVAHSARMYDFYLGGTTNFAPDREAAAHALAVFPWARSAARANRAFMHRSTRALAEAGIRQFLDIGTGIPTSPNLHEIAQRIAPQSRVVYADNDPIVLTHAQHLLHSAPEGRTAYVHADVREPESVLSAARELLDFSRPIALSLNAILHFVPDTAATGAHRLVEAFKAELPPGSALVVSHATQDFAPEDIARVEQVYANAGTPVQARTREEFARLFSGWELLDPGVAATPRWRPDETSAAEPVADAEAACYGAVALRR